MAIMTCVGGREGFDEFLGEAVGTFQPSVLVDVTGQAGVTLRVVALTGERSEIDLSVERTLSSSHLVIEVADRALSKIRWIHKGGKCLAEVGKPISWEERGHRSTTMHARTGRTVWQVFGDPELYSVRLDPSERTDGWSNPLLCGRGLFVQWFEEPVSAS